ncbi:MAG: zinc ABC transporter solute-binding protein, partial [Nitrospinaceae bacterium]|nr:zinc ABC transporter substrate-binding protein [Nitrospinaceae bacterium]NIR54638.1 zinc ABC transporter substrate-binding protein [Nitrospinaceae bacterium]NIS85055.1 zinc ABC transporter substrate-binding protein [Nitrospinaceae bacterium]NIT81872.1 zinc ABC transporter substrate-binding protein [Nitrospinaceae bacterium]NIU44136.1 zinc ABC transporter substrate-binding protein [Nitrospinaceae bacterium]
LNRADLLIYQGLELEIGWLPLLLEGARNPKIMPGQLGHLDLSRGVLPREVPEGSVDRAQGDIHPLGNPHYPLDPKNGVLMAIAIMERLEIMDSENLNAYRKNLQDFLLRLQKKIPEWHSRMKPFQGEPVVTYHQTWAYFLKEFNIKRAGTIERNPGIPPSPKHLTFLAQTMNREKVKVILQANYFESEFSDLLAEKTGARVLKLPVSVGGVPGVENYIDLFDHLVSKLEEAFAQD